jgi:hypothetical protein
MERGIKYCCGGHGQGVVHSNDYLSREWNDHFSPDFPQAGSTASFHGYRPCPLPESDSGEFVCLASFNHFGISAMECFIELAQKSGSEIAHTPGEVTRRLQIA